MMPSDPHALAAMQAAGFFDRVTRYLPWNINPRENRLTEITASMIEQVEGFGDAFALALLPDATAERELSVDPARVQTQLAYGGGFIDLSLWLNDAHGAAHLLWIENKHGAKLTGDQLERYRKAVQAHALASNTEASVVLLADQATMPPDSDIPEGVTKVSWQQVATRIARFHSGLPATDHRHWLVTQYLDYLKRAGLMNPTRFTADHATALNAREEAVAALIAVCDLAQEMLRNGIADIEPRPVGALSRNDGRGTRIGDGQVICFSDGDATTLFEDATHEARWWLQWGVARASDFDGPVAHAGWVFHAGAVTEQPLRAFGEAASYRAWFGQLQERHGAADFALANLDRQGRAVMIAPVGQLLASADSGGQDAAAATPVDDIEQQAERLARWVDAAFHAIKASDHPQKGPLRRATHDLGS